MEVQALSPETIQDTTTSLPFQSSSSFAPTPIPASDIDATFALTTNLTSVTLGARVLAFSDEYFAAAANLLTPTPPIRRPGVFVHTGAWYDGWETRRHNSAPYDWVVISLGLGRDGRARLEGVEVDTAFFDGNHSPLTSLWACEEGGEGADERVRSGRFEGDGWVEVLPRSECGASRRQAWRFKEGSGVAEKRFTHVRVGMWPDGGIARLRVYGHAVPVTFDAGTMGTEEVELSAATNGGLAVGCSDQHFGVMSNLLVPGRGKDMGDGWETARNRGVGHQDWVVVRLGMQGVVKRVVVDTKDFRGNFPRGVMVEGWVWRDGAERDPEAGAEGWVGLLGEEKCAADTEHKFDVGALAGDRVFSHVKLIIVPDGGVKRFRVFGRRRG